MKEEKEKQTTADGRKITRKKSKEKKGVSYWAKYLFLNLSGTHLYGTGNPAATSSTTKAISERVTKPKQP